MNPILRRVLIGLAIAVGLGVAGVTIYLGSALQGLPSVEELRDYEPPVTTRVHAGDGALVAEFANEHRVFVPIEAIPDNLKNAFLSAEDSSFYEHSGVDMRALTRAMISNVGNVLRGRRLEGASTITQQVAGNMLTGRDRTLRRKIREAILAMRLEQAFQGDREARKNRVLELYLNQIYLGQRAFGVAAAALNYFNKSLDELTLAEAAYLASLPKAPNNYHPVRQRERAESRRNWVLERMVRNDYITQEQATAAQAEPLVAVDRLQGEQYVAATHFVEEVRRELVRTRGDEEVNEGGLSVRSTLDTRLQLIAAEVLHAGLETYDRRAGWRGPLSVGDPNGDVERQIEEATAPPALTGWRRAMVTDTSRGVTVTLEGGGTARLADADVRWAAQGAGRDRARALRPGAIVYAQPGTGENARTANLRQTPQLQGALVAMDPNTGRVLAMIGGYDVAGRGYNRATQAERQPGSSIKPIVYAAALEYTGAVDPITGQAHPITPATLIPDDPFAVAAGDGSIWRPENYNRTFNGPTTMRRGLEQSRNAMTARMAYEMGIERVVQYGQRFGVYDQNVQPVFSLALGAGETTLLRLTTAYAIFANGGRRITPIFIDRVQDRYGRTQEVADTRACSDCNVPWRTGMRPPVLVDEREQVIDPITAYQITSMLEGVVQRGTGTVIRSVGAPLAGKTGTTNDYHDAWFVGYAPDLVVGVWAGFDEPRNMGEGESGGRISAPIFRDFMQRALRPEGAREVTAVPFRIPRGVALVRVDAQTGGIPTPETTAMILEVFRPGTEPSLDAVGPAFVFGAGEPADPEVLEALGETLGTAGAATGDPDAASYSLGPPDGVEVGANAAGPANTGAPVTPRTSTDDDLGQLY
jgi:penicillin-binding protein 1A